MSYQTGKQFTEGFCHVGHLLCWVITLSVPRFSRSFPSRTLSLTGKKIVILSLQESQTLSQRNNNLNEYYESLRNNVMSLLEHVRIPGTQEKPTHENLDNYLSKLQTLCTADGYCTDDTQRPLYETVKSALQDFTLLPTPIWDHHQNGQVVAPPPWPPHLWSHHWDMVGRPVRWLMVSLKHREGVFSRYRASYLLWPRTVEPEK